MSGAPKPWFSAALLKRITAVRASNSADEQIINLQILPFRFLPAVKCPKPTASAATRTIGEPKWHPRPQQPPSRRDVKQHKPLPAPNSDFYELYETLNAEELATVKRVRTFMEAKVAPVITKYWVDDAFPLSCCRR